MAGLGNPKGLRAVRVGTVASEHWKDEPEEQDFPAAKSYLLVWGVPLWVADGYHRVCASYHLDEKTQVPCRMTAREPKTDRQ